jgi:hypothetical protein
MLSSGGSMLAHPVSKFSLLLFCFAGLPSSSHARVQEKYGPEIRSFLEYVRHEDVELNFQLEHKEINRKDYLRSKNRLEILKQAVLNYAKETGQDLVPEYHVVAVSEVEELIPGGTEALKGVKSGETIKEKWRFVGTAIRGEKFYILERISNI